MNEPYWFLSFSDWRMDVESCFRSFQVAPTELWATHRLTQTSAMNFSEFWTEKTSGPKTVALRNFLPQLQRRCLKRALAYQSVPLNERNHGLAKARWNSSRHGTLPEAPEITLPRRTSTVASKLQPARIVRYGSRNALLLATGQQSGNYGLSQRPAKAAFVT